MSQHPSVLPQCPLAQAMEVVGGRWRLIILNFLRDHSLRYMELETCIGTISPKMLTAALTELERDGLVSRHVSIQKPLRVDYALTGKGRLTLPILDALIEFGLHYPVGEVNYSAPSNQLAGGVASPVDRS